MIKDIFFEADHASDSLARRASKSLPKAIFDFIEGGAGRELTLARNRAVFDNAVIKPSLSLPITAVDLRSKLFGTTYAAPIGISPFGIAGLVHPKADAVLAAAASRKNIPYVLSCAASTHISVIAESAGRAPWYQLYAPRDDTNVSKLTALPRTYGCPVLILTIDMATSGLRLRDKNNRFTPHFSPAQLLPMLLSRPAWAMAQLRNRLTPFPNMIEPDLRSNVGNWPRLVEMQTGGNFDWATIQRFRDAWPATLLLKGVLTPEVAIRAQRIGIDGVIISNHGGRQLDSAPASLDALHDVANAMVDSTSLLLDSGVRSGEDVLKAISAGAALTMVGRPLLYAIAVGGAPLLDRVLTDLIDETVRAFAIAGRPLVDIHGIGADIASS
ncbi:alpha-hydroxy acid oxidase [Sphingomonas sp. LB2R24]|uniref:alpha-hydroxy acid oxidase n=1 Tax=Sphingomonas sorbitolis TaxID=3096165 RepID=UPI002FCB4A0E